MSYSLKDYKLLSHNQCMAPSNIAECKTIELAQLQLNISGTNQNDIVIVLVQYIKEDNVSIKCVPVHVLLCCNRDSKDLT